jgi:hypothetical protein
MGASLDALDYDLRNAAMYLDQAVHDAGLQGRFTSTLRSRAEQNRLYNRWVQGLSPFPALPPGFSAHEYGWAFDYIVSPYEYQSDIGDYAQQLGLAWAGARDAVHFELPGASAEAVRRGQNQPSGILDLIGSAASAHAEAPQTPDIARAPIQTVLDWWRSVFH